MTILAVEAATRTKGYPRDVVSTLARNREAYLDLGSPAPYVPDCRPRKAARASFVVALQAFDRAMGLQGGAAPGGQNVDYDYMPAGTLPGPWRVSGVAILGLALAVTAIGVWVSWNTRRFFYADVEAPVTSQIASTDFEAAWAACSTDERHVLLQVTREHVANPYQRPSSANYCGAACSVSIRISAHSPRTSNGSCCSRSRKTTPSYRRGSAWSEPQLALHAHGAAGRRSAASPSSSWRRSRPCSPVSSASPRASPVRLRLASRSETRLHVHEQSQDHGLSPEHAQWVIKRAPRTGRHVCCLARAGARLCSPPRRAAAGHAALRCLENPDAQVIRDRPAVDTTALNAWCATVGAPVVAVQHPAADQAIARLAVVKPHAPCWRRGCGPGGSAGAEARRPGRRNWARPAAAGSLSRRGGGGRSTA